MERWRIITDLNGDGKDDMILSDDPEYFGNGGGPWGVYVNSNGFWKCIGDVGLYPSSGAFAFDEVGDEVDLWYYGHCSAQEGAIGYYTFKSDGMKKEFERIFIRGGNDSESVYDRICKDVFGYAGKHPYRFEKSETSTNGLVTWKKFDDRCPPSRKSELFELRQKLELTTKKLAEAEAKVADLSSKVTFYKGNLLTVCGVTLGSKWEGNDTSIVCREEFTGFTNMIIRVDENGYVESILLTRDERLRGKDSGIVGDRFPSAEEQKIIHQVENRHRFKFTFGRDFGTYSWENTFYRIGMKIKFVKDGQSEIEAHYVRSFFDN